MSGPCPASTVRPSGTRSAFFNSICAAPAVITPGSVQPAIGTGRSIAPVATRMRCAVTVSLAPPATSDSAPARRLRSRDRRSFEFQCAGAALAADPHPRPHRDHAALPVCDTVDLGEAVKTDTHHAIGRPRAVVLWRLADAVEPGGEHRGGR